MIDLDVCRIISYWALFHGFEDNCQYPLISPSEVVLDDLAYRIALFDEYKGNKEIDIFYNIDKRSRNRWDEIPYSKGKERRLRLLEPIEEK